MSSSRVVTLFVGITLLIPFGWIFTLMLFRPAHSVAQTAVEIEQMANQLDNGDLPSSSIAIRGEVTQFISIHPALTKCWLWSPRKAVGAAGLAACFVIVCCLIASVCYPCTIKGDWKSLKAHEHNGRAGRFAIGEEPIEGQVDPSQAGPGVRGKKQQNDSAK